MTSNAALEEWRFLIGTWKGKAEGGQFGQKGTIEGKAVISSEPSEMFIMATGENWCEGRLLNKSISILFYDDVEEKFRRKTFFSYGFVNNELECSRSEREIVFNVVMEPLPKQFEQTKFRSFVRKISDTMISMGMEVSRDGEQFEPYGESLLEKLE